MIREPSIAGRLKGLAAVLAISVLLSVGSAAALAAAAAEVEEHALVASPNGRVSVLFSIDASGAPRYAVQLDGKPVLLPSRLGVVREDADFSVGMTLESESRTEVVKDEYELLTSKRRLNRYTANRRVVDLVAGNGEHLQVTFQVSDDGVAFRYSFPRTSATVYRLKSEASSYRFLPETLAWLQPMSAAKTGWMGVNPAYEEIYERGVGVGTVSPTGAGWVYPALFRTGDVWMLVSEASLPRNYCGTRLRSTWQSPEYTVGFPDPLEGIRGGPVNPESSLPWVMPWRFVVVGTLKTVVESTLGTDLAEKPAANVKVLADGPGKASWSWPLLKDDQTTFPVQKRFVDYAAEMGWRYTLVDSMWDQQIGWDKLEELVGYAKSKGVRILVWYNSNGDWNDAPQTPRHMLLTHESRVREFERLAKIGVAGLKVDFFGGDGQSVIGYYRDILEDAAPYGFLMNFHGATLPRGWHRTFPQLMTTEAVRGLEFVTFEQKNAEDEPAHTAMLPFTRNVFDPMDFTPMVLDEVPGIERRTSSAFELALSVLFTSGIQHYAEIPEGMAKAPDYVREFLKGVPSVWEDVRFVDGFPGKYVVIAREGRSPGPARPASAPTRGEAPAPRWYVAGINADAKDLDLKVSLADVPIHVRRGAEITGVLITDGAATATNAASLSFRSEPVRLSADKTISVRLKGRGGFVLAFD